MTDSGSRAAGRPPARPGGPTRPAARPVDPAALRAAFPEVVTLWWGASTHVWRALVHVDGVDAWVTADTLTRLGHALWTRLRSRPPRPPARPPSPRPASATFAGPSRRLPPPPVPSPLDTADFWPGRSAPVPSPTPARAGRRPNLLTRLTDRFRTRRAAA
ncbi:hypothetical protein [Actinocorallia sp. A-T 12471]|uniref:hypothetical protein n=1 Tax=Actinocorallia sp. A-T 12471 TaxID=3089813 RepID=UPI0029D28627|nr:hypothetical protein [Actinocorallia sp. A-T 12471]MDX6742688.1 hypothetical protein [Actinocorallia sp. A-T 12471]